MSLLNHWSGNSFVAPDIEPAGVYSFAAPSPDISIEAPAIAAPSAEQVALAPSGSYDRSQSQPGQVSQPTDLLGALNSTPGRLATTAMALTPLAPLGMAVGLGRGIANATNNISNANYSRNAFGLGDMGFGSSVATGLGFDGFDFSDNERTSIASQHGTVGDVGAPGALNVQAQAGASEASAPTGSLSDHPDYNSPEFDPWSGGMGSESESENDDSVICTELYRQGLIDAETYNADGEFGRDQEDYVIEGYHLWAKPVVRGMQKSPVLTAIIRGLAMPFIRDMVRVTNGEKSSVKLSLGVWICGAIGGFWRAVEVD